IEARFKAGRLRILVSSASLELGLDLGHVDRVCQLGVPGSVNLVRQRAGRSGHRPGRTPCMHLFPLTLNQLVETHALAVALNTGQIDAGEVPQAALDVLAQHLAAMAAGGEKNPEAMLEVVRTARQYGDIDRETLDSMLALLAGGVEHMPAGQSEPLISLDAAGAVRPQPATARMVLTNAGVIPEFFEYEVVRTDTGERIGMLDEEFAFESSPGQVLQLGRRAWRILRVLTGQVRVEPADEEPAHLPFWFGEGPGRTRLMADAMLAAMAGAGSGDLHPQAARMLAESRQALGALPSAERLVVERFPDPGGDRHVVLHTFAGARINRAWGLALRKRFCRRFNFELQAAATDDGILISLGVTSRFELAEVAGFVRSYNVADVLTQALLDTPLFVTRFRWCANNALVLLKNGPQGRIQPQRQRSQAENLIACVFPDQLACLENLSGPREVPNHPLVQQALADCLHDYMDLQGLQRLLARIECGAVKVHAVDTPEPSPLARALIHAPRHSYLDEAAAEERRTRNFERPPASAGQPAAPRKSSSAVPSGPAPLSPQSSTARTCRPGNLRASPDNLERLLLGCGFLTAAEGEAGLGLARPAPAGGWNRHFSTLVHHKRALTITTGPGAANLWIAAERLGWFIEFNPELE
ncbi:MAG: helicase-related protein, partial [Wenzhouxiangellaceae bacterium]